MKTIDFDPPFSLEGVEIKQARIAPLRFLALVELARKVQAALTPAARYETMMQRERLAKQVTFITSADAAAQLTIEQVLTLPAPVAKRLIPALADDEGKPGVILNKGDGVSTPIHYKFGTSIKGGKNVEIAEVEFIASTYGDIEDVLSGDINLYQVLDLLKIARPVGGTLLSLPSWALEQITMADGVTITNKILPSFLE